MAKDFAKSFYNSTAWKNCRDEYKKSVGYLCERCLQSGKCVLGDIVHHKIKLTPANINDPTVTLNFDNLELVCRSCHRKAHGRNDSERRYIVGENGKIIFK